MQQRREVEFSRPAVAKAQEHAIAFDVTHFDDIAQHGSLQRLDRDNGSLAAVTHMEMRREVVVIIQPDDDAEETG